MTTLKHFPGHGSSTEDSHLGVTDVTNTWQSMELQPYRDLVGKGVVDLVMTAHVFNANLAPYDPATLSPVVVTELLRNDIGFDGFVISDDMQVGAIVQHYGFEEALTRAVAAGVDLLLISDNNPDVGYDPAVAERAVTHI